MNLYAYTAIIDCRLVLCAKPQCPNPIPANPAKGKCCPTCPGRLLPAGKYITRSKHWFGINFTDSELMPVGLLYKNHYVYCIKYSTHVQTSSMIVHENHESPSTY